MQSLVGSSLAFLSQLARCTLALFGWNRGMEWLAVRSVSALLLASASSGATIPPVSWSWSLRLVVWLRLRPALNVAEEFRARVGLVLAWFVSLC